MCLALTAVVFLSTGCWDALDVNKKDITTVASADYKDGLYYFYTEIPNFDWQSGQSGEHNTQRKSKMFNVVVSSGDTPKDARDNLETKLDRPLLLGTSRAALLGQGILKKGIGEFMYRLRENVDHRTTSVVVTTQDDIYALLNTHTENEISAGNTIEHSMLNMSGQGMAATINISEVLEYLSSRNACFVLPNYDIVADEIAFTGYSVMLDGKYAGFLPFEDSRGTVYFLNDDAEWIYTVPVDDNTATVKVMIQQRKIIPHHTNGEVSFNVDYTFHTVVMYLKNASGFDQLQQDQVKKRLQDFLLSDISRTVTLAQSVYRCDFLGFSEAFRIAYPQEYKKMSWTDSFLKAKIAIRVKTSLDPSGRIIYDLPQQH
jgi:Ger(x)C family germination protein